MGVVGIRDLIDAGAHFGHPVSRWHPKMAPYIYGKRNLIHIIDLRQTIRGILRGRHFLKNVVADGGMVLLVGTKRQAKATVTTLAQKAEMPYVSERWPGGMLTNFQTVRSRLKRLEELEQMEEDGTINRYSKKMISSMRREKRKIMRNLDGVRNMTELPAAVLIVDPRSEMIAVKEARILNIPTVAIIDTDCDPELVDIPVPANDDAFRSVQVILASLTEGIEQGVVKWKEKARIAEKMEAQKEDAARKAKEAREVERKKAAAKASVKAAPVKKAAGGEVPVPVPAKPVSAKPVSAKPNDKAKAETEAVGEGVPTVPAGEAPASGAP
ncbi:MAG: 30S ribosomal protein S2 [Planctomycetota bacterium]|nr:30S ribosomal protein S2 [Planctomycetota bacterium]